MLICHFTIPESADADELERAVGAALDEAKQVGATRVGELTGYRLLAGRRAGSEGGYQLEIEGLMVLPPGLKDALESAGAENLTSDEYTEVLSSSSNT